MAKTRIAVVGAGLIGRRHIEEIQNSAACELAAVVDPSSDAAALAHNAGVPYYPSLEALLAQHRPDGAVLATPNQLHVAQGLQCIAAGLPVLIEKPIAATLADGLRLVEAAEQRNHKLLVGHHRPHSPILQQAVDVIKSGILGPIVAVQGSALFYKPDDYFDAAAWRRQPGGGPDLINMIHEVGNLRAMVGEIVAVQAITSNTVRQFPVEDTAAINLRFANGALGSFLLSDTAGSARSWEQTAQENKSYASYPDEDCYVIVGTNGSLAVPTMRLKYYEKITDRSWWKPFQTRTVECERADPLARQIEHFGAVIRGEAKPLVSGRDGLQNLRVIEAIVTAANTGATVDVMQ